MNVVEALRKGLPVQTTGGREAILSAIIPGAPAPVVVAIAKPKSLIKDGNDGFFLESYDMNGKYIGCGSGMDLRIATPFC